MGTPLMGPSDWVLFLVLTQDFVAEINPPSVALDGGSQMSRAKFKKLFT